MSEPPSAAERGIFDEETAMIVVGVFYGGRDFEALLNEAS